MRRSASEVIRNLEMRIARLEKKASSWKSSSVYIYDESRGGFQSQWIATDKPRDVKSALNRIGVEIVNEEVFNHVLGNQHPHSDYSIYIYELEESIFGLANMKAEQKKNDLLYSIKNQIDGENPYNKSTQQKISEIIYGKIDEEEVEEIKRELGLKTARLEKSAYTSWEETATQELVEELRLDPSEVSYEIDFIKHDAQVLSVKTRWDEYILFQFEDEYDNFMDRELMERVKDMSYTTLTKILAKSGQPLINFAPRDVWLDGDDIYFLKDLAQYRNILKKVEDESRQSELISDLCRKLNRNPLLVTKSEKVIKRLYEYLSIDIMEMVEEFGITPEHYEEVGSLRESYALRVI